MIDPILKAVVETWALMFANSIIPVWFIISTIITTAFVMRVNHLDFKRVLFYATLFTFFLVGSEGPRFHYIAIVLHKPMTTPELWAEPTFRATFYASLMLGVLVGYAFNKLLDLFFDDFNLSVAHTMQKLSEFHLKRSKAYKMANYSMNTLQAKAIDAKLANEKLKVKIVD